MNVCEAFNCICTYIYVYSNGDDVRLPYVPCTYVHIMSSRLADMTALYASVYMYELLGWGIPNLK